MAPRRGGGGGGGGLGGISASCPAPFTSNNAYSWTTIPTFVNYCLFFVVTLIIMIMWGKTKKRNPHVKKLAGAVYGWSLFFLLMAHVLIIIGTMLRECGTTSFMSYFNWAIAFNIFFKLSQYLMLVVVFWGVNDVLRQRLGDNPRFLGFVYGSVLGLMGLLTCAYIGLICYNNWTNTDQGWHSDPLVDEIQKLAVAYWVLFLMTVVIGGGLAVVTMVTMRSRQIVSGNLLPLIAGLYFAMFIWVLFTVVEVGSSLSERYLGNTVYEAFDYIISVFQSLAFVLILFIAKSHLFKAPVDNTNPQVYNQPTYAQVPHQQVPQQQVPQQQMYAPVPIPQQHQQPMQQYQYNNGPQPYYYQQQPVYSNNTTPINGGHVVNVK